MATQRIGGRRGSRDRTETGQDLPKLQPPLGKFSRPVNQLHGKPSRLPEVDVEHSQSKPWRQDTVEAAKEANEQNERHEKSRAPSEPWEENSPKVSILDNYTHIPGFQMPSHFHRDITEHFSMDVVDDIEGQLEEVSRLKRWGHFNDALDYFRVNLEDHLDLPLVAIGYANLLLEQGSYKQVVDFISSRQPHPPKRTKCIPIGNGAVGRDLYETHINLLQLRARLSFESLSSRELELLQLDFHSFVQYLEERAYSRHVDRLSIARGMPIDPTEVQIICELSEILSFIMCEQEIAIPNLFSEVWQDLYDDLLMDGRIWELCDLLIAMFGLLGPWETFAHFFKDTPERLFDQAKDAKTYTRGSLERLLQDWSVDEYDESTELALLSIMVELRYFRISSSQSRSIYRTINDQWCAQQANLCAEKLRQHSPHLMRSRPYLQWAFAEEYLDHLRNPGPSYQEERQKCLNKFPGLDLDEWSLPTYIPMASENPGWPAADPKFPPNNSLNWILKTSTELGDFKTRSTCLRELICRVEDPQPLLKELDQLLLVEQGDHLRASESIISQYLLATDDKSCRKLLQRLEDVAEKFGPTPENDVCVATRWNNLMVQNALRRSLSEDKSIIGKNAKIAQSIYQKLPYSQKAIDKFSGPALITKDKDSGEAPKKNEQKEPKKPAEEKKVIEKPKDDPKDDLKAPGKFESRYEEDLNRRLRQLEILELQQKREQLEEELRNAKVRRRLEEFEDELRVEAGKEEIRSKLREEGLNVDAKASDEISHNTKRKKETVWKRTTDGDTEKKEETQIGEKGTPMALEPEEIERGPGEGDQKSPEHSRKPYRYAFVTEPEEEPLVIEERDSNPVSFVRRTRSAESVASSAESFENAVEVPEDSSGTK